MSIDPFVFESDMVEALMPRIRRLAGWRKGDVDVFFEVAATRGVPDVVAVQFKDRLAGSSQRQAAVEYTDVAAWIALTDRAAEGQDVVSARELSVYLGVSGKHLGRAVLPRLLDRGVVVPAGRGRWLLTMPYKSPISRLVTVELKTRDRLGALRQAAAHGQGADRSWVVLDEARMPVRGSAAEVALEAYARRGVGLATLRGGGGALTILSQPRRGGVASYSDFTRRVARSVLAERVLALRLAGLNAGPTWPVFGRLLPTGRPLVTPTEASALDTGVRELAHC